VEKLSDDSSCDKSKGFSREHAENKKALLEGVKIAAYATETKWLFPFLKTTGWNVRRRNRSEERGRLTHFCGATIVRSEFYERSFG
jgi:hypothetical protein